MELDIRPMREEEIKYTYAQSQQLKGQTGSIGRLRGDFDSGGFGFYSSWDDHLTELKTDEFKLELDEVINSLRSKEYGLLANRTAMVKFTKNYHESEMNGNYTKEYGFRVDTDKFSYLLRCNPIQGDYNFYCFCYLKDWLNNHIQNAERGIRFIGSSYQDLFQLKDGEHIRITLKDGKEIEKSCRYIDDYHLEVGDRLYHICEFAEIMEENGNKYEPLSPKTEENRSKVKPKER